MWIWEDEVSSCRDIGLCQWKYIDVWDYAFNEISRYSGRCSDCVTLLLAIGL